MTLLASSTLFTAIAAPQVGFEADVISCATGHLLVLLEASHERGRAPSSCPIN